MGYFVFVVVKPMTEPSPFFKELSKNYQSRLNTENNDQKLDKLTLDLTIILEYVNADIRTAGVQIAFSLVMGLFFAVISILLFAAGISGALNLQGEYQASKFSLATSAPGMICLLISGCIIVIGIQKNTTRPLTAQVERAMGADYSQEKTSPPVADKAESEETAIGDDMKEPIKTDSKTQKANVSQNKPQP